MKSATPAVKTRSRELAARFTAAGPLDGGDHVYRVIEVVGTSSESISDAIARAHKTLRNLRWFEVMRTSGHIENGKVRHYQVTLSVGFTMEEPGSEVHADRKKNPRSRRGHGALRLSPP